MDSTDFFWTGNKPFICPEQAIEGAKHFSPGIGPEHASYIDKLHSAGGNIALQTTRMDSSNELSLKLNRF
jgi:hypothetical protein